MRTHTARRKGRNVRQLSVKEIYIQIYEKSHFQANTHLSNLIICFVAKNTHIYTAETTEREGEGHTLAYMRSLHCESPKLESLLAVHLNRRCVIVTHFIFIFGG